MLLSQDKQAYVAILSSFSYDDVQSTTLAKAIGDKINHLNPDIFVNIMYAGMESIPSYTSGRFAMQGAFATCRINERLVTPSVMVILGDEAWMMYRTMTLNGVWAKIPIILCGVQNNLLKNCADFYASRQINDTLMIPVEESVAKLPVAGVITPENPAEMLRFIRQLIPDATCLHYVSTNSYRDIYLLDKLQNVFKPEFGKVPLNIIHLNAKNKDSVQTVLNSLPHDAPVMMYTNKEKLKSSAPIFIVNQYVFTGDNVVGSFSYSLGSIVEATADCILKKLQNPEDKTPYFTTLNTASIHLNKEALLNFQLNKQAKQLSQVTYHNVPEYYVIRHIRLIGFILLVLSVSGLSGSLYFRAHFYKKKIANLLNNYKNLYNEYLTVYQNLPIGLILYNSQGKLVGQNKESEKFIQNIQAENPDFDIQNYDSVTLARTPYYDLAVKNNLDAAGEVESRLVMAYDRRDAEQEKQLKKNFFQNMIFAMEKSDLGIAQYNLLSYKGFSNRIWKKHLGLSVDNSNFANKLENIHPDDRKKIETFYQKVIDGKAQTFIENIQVSYNGETHYLRYIIHILRYAPKESRILAIEVILNIDEQIQKEQELLTAIHRAQESYKLKSAFISNMDEDINVFLDNIKTQINNLQLIKSKSLYSYIATNINNESLEFLTHLDKVIQLSKTESITTENGA